MSIPRIRPATEGDIPFLVEAVMAAEKSGTGIAPMATLHGLPETEVRALLKNMFEEGIEGCEFSVSSFLIAEVGGTPAAAVAGWVEGANEDGMPSGMLRANLIGFTFPPEALITLRAHGPAVTPLAIPRTLGALQIEYVYTAPDHRGKRLAGDLIQQHITNSASAALAQVQVFSMNTAAIALYTALGFTVQRTFRTDHPQAATLLPHPEKLLMERPLP